LLLSALLSFSVFKLTWLGVICLVFAGFFLLNTASYMYTTRWGKFTVWASILAQARLKGDERLLDLGCGRGAVLLMAASLLPSGRAVGVDLWKAIDQSGNTSAATLHNADLEGVAERIDLITADIQHLPLADGSFDVLVSSLAIHNIRGTAGHLQAISEAVRVLHPGGRLMIADILHTDQYAERLRQLGMDEVICRRLGWRFWYGSPWVATTLVSARKPA
jgi:ubiquinone/menaquinone biosynthesis C-methylase UbiE